MSSTGIGQRAEEIAATFLSERGFMILDRNWRISAAEIDIVAQRSDVVFFVEVKYRRRPHAGDGLAYISPSKLRRMQRAAELWCLQNQYEGDRELSAIEVSGERFTVTEFIATLT